MVEMVETANILCNATPKSLVILDEIGRGTSTYDGLSIAWSVAEYLHNDIQCRSLFATHYHELTQLARSCRGIGNFNVAVKEYGKDIIFLRRILPGASDRSDGIHVARLAGVPEEVLDRANNVLEKLEQTKSNTKEVMTVLPREEYTPPRKKRKKINDDTMSLNFE